MYVRFPLTSLKTVIVIIVLLTGIVFIKHSDNITPYDASKVNVGQRLILNTGSNNQSELDDFESKVNTHKFPGEFNLIEDASRYTGALERPPRECSLEIMNTERLQQDHPCVINNIKKHFLKPPASAHESLNLDYPDVKDPSDGQSEAVLHLLRNKTNGFFIECGALDGENLSNTLYMERFLNWTGILIEADQEIFKNLLSRKRKSWSLPVCLSEDPYPQEVKFRAAYALGHTINDKVPHRNLSGVIGGYGRENKVQCFPLYSILLAMNRTEVDYFSLDVEQHDIHVLKTIPFSKVNIKILSVEAFRYSQSEKETYRNMVDYMKTQGYVSLLPIDVPDDVIFIRRDYAKTIPKQLVQGR